VSGSATHEAISSVWKSESARVVAVLARIVRDVGVAEELAQDALVAALEEWPRSGVPERPGAWLMTTAKNRALNALRRTRLVDEKHEALAHELPSHVSLEELEAALEAGMDEDVSDDVLRLMFAACHPLLSGEARVALTLKLIGGLSTQQIARAFLVPEPTIAQRVVRAKRTLAEAGIVYEVPRGDELGARLSSVLEVVYLVFNEGYSATSGDDLMRPALVDEALRLGRMLAELAPAEPEVLALLALMELQASRGRARMDANNEPVLLMEQDRSLWDSAVITSGLEHLGQTLGPPGPYRLQASIAACHARARSPEETDWKQIAALYGELLGRVPSPVVALNHAVAVSRAEGPREGLILLDGLANDSSLATYPFLPAARADLLEKLGRLDEARAEFERAASLTENATQRARLLLRARDGDGKRS
jgi:RNA polymerase sigma factor (sigma-70 family)